ncbi:MAG: LysR family transcriptional regulator [Xanthomonadaceae bacterium]|jgi:LysR family hydrogen peroxide-inducible transcriptional activator|nr:LysR family transcriptional regulator [Xanthomonadaceae bacterium]
MNLRDLKYLVALADHRHFGRAAAASHVSQPTLSTQIKKLEDELGVALVERAPRKVMLTPAGHEAAERARQIVAEVEQMKEAARRSQDPEAGTVRLGIFPTLAPYLLPHVIPQVRTRFPQLELLLTEDKSDVLLTRLREGKLDAAILVLPLHDDQLHAEFLFEEPFVLAVPGNHPLARRESLSVQDLAHQQLLLLEDGHCLRDQSLEVCRLAGAQERAEFRGTSLETLRQMVAANVGITLIPMLAAKPPAMHADNVQLLPFTDATPSRKIAMVWRRTSAMSSFLSELTKTFKNLPAELLAPLSEPTPSSHSAKKTVKQFADTVQYIA